MSTKKKCTGGALEILRLSNPAEARIPFSLASRFVGKVQNAVDYANKFRNVFPWASCTRGFLDGDSYGLTFFFDNEKGICRPETKYEQEFDHQVGTSLLTRFHESIKPRAFMWVEYEVGGVDLLVINTYMSNGVHNPRREKQLDQIARELLLRDLRLGRIDPAMFMGDTNADRAEPEMQKFHRVARFRDSLKEANPDLSISPHKGMTWDPDGNRLTDGPLREPPQGVDFISVRDGKKYRIKIKTSRIALDKKPNSDHYAIYTEFEIIPACEDLIADLF